MARRIKSVAGLDADFLEECINELEDGEVVNITGYNDVMVLLDYLQDELGLEFDFHIKGSVLVLVPFE